MRPVVKNERHTKKTAGDDGDAADAADAAAGGQRAELGCLDARCAGWRGRCSTAGR